MLNRILILLRVIAIFILPLIASCNKSHLDIEDVSKGTIYSEQDFNNAVQSFDTFANDTLFLQEEYKKGKMSNDSLTQYATSFLLSKTHSNNLHFRSSFINKVRYLKILQEIGSPLQVVSAQNELARIYFSNYMVDESIRYYFKSLAQLPKLDSKDTNVIREEAKTKGGIGIIYAVLGNERSAENYLQQSEQLAQTIGDNEILASNLKWRGYLFEQNERYDSAYAYYKQSLDYYIESNSTSGMAELFLNIGEVYTKMGEVEEALIYLENAKTSLENTSEQFNIIKSHILTAAAYEAINKYDDAILCLNKAAKIANGINSEHFLQRIHYALAEIYHKKNDSQMAGHHRRIGNSYEKSLNLRNIQTNLFNTQKEFENAIKQKEINDLIMTYKVKARTQRIIIAATTTIMVLIIGLFIVYGYYLKMRKSKRDMLVKTAQLKTSLYDQISDDIKSPVTIITGITEKLRQNLADGNSTKNIIDLDIINRQTQNIAFLINNALAFSTSNDKISTQWVNGDIVSYLKFLLNCYADDADVRGVDMVFLSSHEKVVMNFCKERLKIVINNILSVAIKESSKDEKVVMNIRYDKVGKECFINITHKGNPKKDSDIPESFKKTMAENNVDYNLHYFSNKVVIANQLVKDMGGTFSIKQTTQADNMFRIQLPVQNNIIHKKFTLFEEEEATSAKKTSESLINVLNKQGDTMVVGEKKKGHLLIVEDNQFMSFYIASLLSRDYSVSTAQNGIEALNIIEQNMPDLIITDLMMPQMNGNELTAAIKKTPATSHIPVIMITVKESDDSRIQSIKAGVDWFLVKPFVDEELMVLVDQLLTSRKGLLKRLGQILQDRQNRTDSKVNDEDFTFIQKISEIIHSEINNSDLSPQMIADRMYISASHLNRKIKAITDFSTSGYILNLRLNRAKKLLITTQKHIGEVAMDCGFNDFAYFSRTFKKEFGITPSQYQRMGVK